MVSQTKVFGEKSLRFNFRTKFHGSQLNRWWDIGTLSIKTISNTICSWQIWIWKNTNSNYMRWNDLNSWSVGLFCWNPVIQFTWLDERRIKVFPAGIGDTFLSAIKNNPDLTLASPQPDGMIKPSDGVLYTSGDILLTPWSSHDKYCWTLSLVQVPTHSMLSMLVLTRWFLAYNLFHIHHCIRSPAFFYLLLNTKTQNAS